MAEDDVLANNKEIRVKIRSLTEILMEEFSGSKALMAEFDNVWPIERLPKEDKTDSHFY